MARKLKVYGWSAFYIRGAEKQFNQSFRCIVAATSQADAARLAGKEKPRDLWQLTETGNAGEIALATTKPGTVFFQVHHAPAAVPWQELDDVKRL